MTSSPDHDTAATDHPVYTTATLGAMHRGKRHGEAVYVTVRHNDADVQARIVAVNASVTILAPHVGTLDVPPERIIYAEVQPG